VFPFVCCSQCVGLVGEREGRMLSDVCVLVERLGRITEPVYGSRGFFRPFSLMR
jgi:hypothetical protein